MQPEPLQSAQHQRSTTSGKEDLMAASRPVRVLLTLCVVACAARTAAAQPVTVTGGYIQITRFATDFLIQTSQFGLAGELEGTFPSFEPLLSGFPDEMVNLSSSFSGRLSSFTIFDPDRRDVAARVEFRFMAGAARIPSVDDAWRETSAATVDAPFSFIAEISGYNSYEEMIAGGPPAFTIDLRGRGEAHATFIVQRTNTGEPLFDEPLVAGSVINRFGVDTAAPVAEPGTIARGMGGAPALGAHRRRRLLPARESTD
jgi:hypothetical protein